MTDDKTTLRQIRKRMSGFVSERDWDQFHTPKNLAMGLAIEAAELMEHVQWIGSESSRGVAEDPQTMQQISCN